MSYRVTAAAGLLGFVLLLTSVLVPAEDPQPVSFPVPAQVTEQPSQAELPPWERGPFEINPCWMWRSMPELEILSVLTQEQQRRSGFGFARLKMQILRCAQNDRAL